MFLRECKMLFFLLFLLFCFSSLGAYDNFTIKIEADVTSISADSDKFYVGTDEGLETYDAGSKILLEKVLEGHRIIDIKKHGSKLFVLGCNFVENKVYIYNISDSLSYILPEITSDIKTFFPVSSTKFILYNSDKNVLISFNTDTDEISELSNNNLGFGTYEPIELTDIYISEPESICGTESFYFILSPDFKQISYVNNGEFSTYARCDGDICSFSIDDDHFYPWFAASLIRDDSKMECENAASFYFSSDNLIFYADFSELAKVIENDNPIVDFYHYDDGFFIAETNKVLFLKK